MKKDVKQAQEPDQQGPDRIVAIHRPKPGDLRMRRVITRRGIRVRIKVASWKMGRAMHAESRDEAVAFALLDGDPEVREYHEQPCLIEYVHKGKLRKHYPDIEIRYAHRKLFWEVKGTRQASETEIEERTAFMRSHLAGQGYGYELVTAQEIKRDPRLGTMEFLLRWGRAEVHLTQYEEIRRRAVQRGGLLWGDFLQEVGAMTRANACRLALEGRLHLDLTKPLTRETPVELVEEGA